MGPSVIVGMGKYVKFKENLRSNIGKTWFNAKEKERGKLKKCSDFLLGYLNGINKDKQQLKGKVGEL